MPYKRAKITEKYKPQAKRLLDQLREVLRYHHYSIRTEEAYVKRVARYIRFNETRHLREMHNPEIEPFLSHPAINRLVAAAKRNQASNAI